MAKRKPVRSPENKAIDPAPENKAGTGRREELPHAPKFWKYETSGVLAPAVQRYLSGAPLTTEEVAVLRDYCRQWIASAVWEMNPHGNGVWLADLRRGVEGITSLEALRRWLATAEAAGCDPL
jgi:hypothetical protein